MTRYKGSYIDVRDGKRVHIIFTYNVKDGKFINEREEKIIVL